MAIFKKGDIVFAEDINSRMIVFESNDEKVVCVPANTYDIDSLTLFKRPGISASQVSQGVARCEVHIFRTLEDFTIERIGYGKVYDTEDFDDLSWIVDNKGNVYVAQEQEEGEYRIFSDNENLYARSEDNVIDDEDV